MDPKRWLQIGLAPGTEQKPVRVCDRPDCGLPGDFKAPKSRRNLRDYHRFCFAHVQAYNREWNYCDGMDEGQIEANRRDDVTWQRQTWPMGVNAHAHTTQGETAADRAEPERGREDPGTAPRDQGTPPRGHGVDDPFGLFSGTGWSGIGESGTGGTGIGGSGAQRKSKKTGRQNARERAYESALRRRFSSEVADALRLFGLTLPLEKQDLQARYKRLAKQLHPDSNINPTGKPVCAQSKADKEELFKQLNTAYGVLKENLTVLTG